MIQCTRPDPESEVTKSEQVIKGFIRESEILSRAEKEIEPEGQALGGRQRLR